MRILIIGCGKLGIETASLLSAGGHSVTGLRRRIEFLPAWLESVAIDVLDRASLEVLPALKPDLVIYQATPAAYNESAYRDIYVSGVNNSIAALQTCNVPVLLVSSTGVYHQADGSWVDEASDTHPSTFNGQIMLEGEQQALSCDLSFVVRFSGIYGASRLRLLERVRNADWSASDLHWTNRIHESDCARVLAHISELVLHSGAKPEGLPRVWLASDCEPAPYAEVMAFLAAELGVELPDSGATPNNTSRRTGSKRCCNRQLLDSGFQFIYPDYRIGYREILELHRKAGDGKID